MVKRQTKYIKPLLRWAGGKNWILKYIDQYLPKEFKNYFEPFVGGASIALFLKQNNKLKNKVFLSDSNRQLINFYKTIQKYPDQIISELDKYKNEKEEYYLERDKNYLSDIECAAQFYYLNRTSFNGIYRENLKGEYNVPYGHKKYKILFDKEQIKNVSRLIKGMNFNYGDFSQNYNKLQSKDLIFIDPPYTVAHENNGFIKYNQKIFSWEDQKRLKDFVLYVEKVGAYYVLTNAYHLSIQDLYKNIGRQVILERPSVIGGRNATRTSYKEILITNIDI